MNPSHRIIFFFADVLDSLIADHGLQSQDYAGVRDLAAVWRDMSQEFEYYTKLLYFAIRGFIKYGSNALTDVKRYVKRKEETGEKPFPESSYEVAKGLADEFKLKFDQGSTDQQIISYFESHSDMDRKFIPSEFFVDTLRDDYDP